MEYRPLGKSSLDVSVVGFGCGGNAQLMVGDDADNRVATLKRALDAGVNLFDTAPAYGEGRSEINLGRDLAALEAEPIISTKVVLRPEDLGDPRGAVLRHIEASLDRLGRSNVHLLTLHNRVFQTSDGTTFGIGAKLGLDEVLGRRGVAQAFEELRAGGVVTTVGFTTLGGDVSAIAQLLESGAFGAITVSMNLLNPSAAVVAPPTFSGRNHGDVVARARDAGLGVMVVQALARGTLVARGPGDGPGGEVARAALEYDGSLAQTAVRYVLGKFGVSTAILGFSQPEHVDDAVAAVEKGSLPAELERKLESLALRS